MDTIRTISDAVTRGNEFVRPYLKKVADIFEPEYAKFRLVIYYHSGKKSFYPSMDYVQKTDGKTTRDEYSGLYKLIRLAETKFKTNQTVKSAVIYATADKLPETSKSDYSILIYKKTKFSFASNDKVRFNRNNELILIP